MSSNSEISHRGRVLSVTPEVTTVEIISESACGACHAKGFCSLGESKVKRIEVPTSGWSDFRPGDEVEVEARFVSNDFVDVEPEDLVLAAWQFDRLPADVDVRDTALEACQVVYGKLDVTCVDVHHTAILPVPLPVPDSQYAGLLASQMDLELARVHVLVPGGDPVECVGVDVIIAGFKTFEDALRIIHRTTQSVGKEAVLLKKECPGFISNRLQLALYREVQDLVMRGVCSVEDADKALVYGPGLRWAIFGHNMIMQLGNPGGLTGMVNMLGNSGDRWLADMASWTHQPDNWAEVAQPGVDQEMKNFPDYIGHTNEACAAYRDQMLIELLKLHRKL